MMGIPTSLASCDLWNFHSALSWSATVLSQAFGVPPCTCAAQCLVTDFSGLLCIFLNFSVQLPPLLVFLPVNPVYLSSLRFLSIQPDCHSSLCSTFLHRKLENVWVTPEAYLLCFTFLRDQSPFLKTGASYILSIRFLCPWEFSRQEYWSGLPCPPPEDHLPKPGIKLRSPALQVDSLPSEPPGKPKNTGLGSLAFLQEVFLTQELNQGLLYCRQILYHLSCQESPYFVQFYSYLCSEGQSSAIYYIRVRSISCMSIYRFGSYLQTGISYSLLHTTFRIKLKTYYEDIHISSRSAQLMGFITDKPFLTNTHRDTQTERLDRLLIFLVSLASLQNILIPLQKIPSLLPTIAFLNSYLSF